MNMNIYSNPLAEDIVQRRCLKIFHWQEIFYLKKLWIALAESEKELGLHITDEQIEEMKLIFIISIMSLRTKESEFRHDVMAHVHTFGTQAKLCLLSILVQAHLWR